MKTQLIFMIFLFSAFVAFAHPFFVSMTEIVFHEKEQEIQVSVRIFTDDLEKALSKDCHCKIDFTNISDTTKLRKHLQNYLIKALKISTNGNPKKFDFLGFEREEESIWSYLSAPQKEKIQSMEVDNSSLYQTQQKQNNVVRFKSKNIDATRQLQFPETKLKF